MGGEMLSVELSPRSVGDDNSAAVAAQLLGPMGNMVDAALRFENGVHLLDDVIQFTIESVPQGRHVPLRMRPE